MRKPLTTVPQTSAHLGHEGTRKPANCNLRQKAFCIKAFCITIPNEEKPVFCILHWNLHDLIMTKSFQISKDMGIEMIPHAMYFTSDLDTVTKINHVPYQTIA